MIRACIWIISLGVIISTMQAQTLTNSDLDGISGISSLPTGWQNVPYGDPACLATGVGQDTPDLTDTAGPLASNGIVGNPYSGTTFISGLIGGQGMFWHEGIMQTVSGFTVGNTYSIGFYQSVVKQTSTDYLDTSGAWAVYLDNTLIGVSASTVSLAASGSISFIWEFRTMNFTATSNTHTLKFMPADDDPDQSTNNSFGGLRMGIDSIFISSPLPASPPTANLGNDTTLCQGQNLLLDATYAGATYLWQDGSTNPTYTVSSSGTYWVEVTNSGGTVTDSIIVNFNPVPIVNLGIDASICNGDTLLLDATFPGANYLWQDNSSSATFIVTQPGSYSVQVSIGNCSASDQINITSLFAPVINLGNDTSYCDAVSVVLDATTPGASYQWQDNSSNPTLAITTSGTYSVELSNACGSSSDTITIDFRNCACFVYVPNSFTPNEDDRNNFFVPVSNCDYVGYHFSVFNRWGSLIFQSGTPGQAWDGKHNNQPAPLGVYVFMVSYEFDNVKPETMIGHLNLLR